MLQKLSRQQPAITLRKRKTIKTMYKQKLLAAAVIGALAFTSASAAEITPAEARAIAKEAYIYGFPMVDGYRIQYAYFVDRENAEFKAPWNQLRNISRVFTPEDKAIQTPNSDTPYSTSSALICAPNRLCSRCRPLRRSAISASNLLTPTRTTSPTSAAARPATTEAVSSSPGPAGKAGLPRA